MPFCSEVAGPSFGPSLYPKYLAATIPCFGCSAPLDSDTKSSHFHGVFLRQLQWTLNPSTWTIVALRSAKKRKGLPKEAPHPEAGGRRGDWFPSMHSDAECQ